MAINGTEKHDLFISEAECEALIETVEEIMFMIPLLRSINILIQLPVMVRVVNEDAIFLAINITPTCQTKHGDRG